MLAGAVPRLSPPALATLCTSIDTPAPWTPNAVVLPSTVNGPLTSMSALGCAIVSLASAVRSFATGAGALASSPSRSQREPGNDALITPSVPIEVGVIGTDG